MNNMNKYQMGGVFNSGKDARSYNNGYFFANLDFNDPLFIKSLFYSLEQSWIKEGLYRQ